ncbi:MAG: class I SAM-dependent methyltransferase [Rhodospirillaceae bacterium]|nr:class I SAM-dependent methyltransferase [Rhodospirillales bacterium]
MQLPKMKYEREGVVMSGSSRFGKQYTEAVLRGLMDAGHIRRVVDVGAGSGTYRKLLDGAAADVHWTAVEAWTPYIAEFNLNTLYDEVANQNVCDFSFAEAKADLVIFGDVVEHMTKEEAIEVVTRAVDAAPYVIISIPVVYYPQDEVNGNPFERHVKDDWTNREVLDSMPDVVSVLVHDHIGVYLLSANFRAIRNIGQFHPDAVKMLRTEAPTEYVFAT